MIKANELRIGNWIHDAQVGQTQWHPDDFVEYAKHMHRVSPIPLTEEILVKCGLIDHGQWGEGVRFDIKINSELLSYLSIFIPTGTALMHYDCIHDAAGGGLKIEHLHQLQNLYFALTGEELEYKP